MSSETIEISIIIPTYNRGERLLACLDALARQTLDSAMFEVIVVVDGSTDGTVEKLNTITTPFSLRVIEQENSGQNNARNKGVLHARGAYCLFIDDDIIASPRLAAEHLQAQKAYGGAVVLGQMKMLLPANADRFTQCYADGWYEHYAALAQGQPPTWMDLYGGNFSIPRGLFQKVGGFARDMRRSHDIEFGYRLKQAGVHFVYVDAAVGVQDENKSAQELMADAEKAGAAWVALYQRHPPVLDDLLGDFADAGKREVNLRRFLLASNVPPYLLTFFAPLLINPRRIYKWHRFLLSLCYWRGVRRAVPDKETWKRLTGGVTILAYHAVGAHGEPSSDYILPARRFEQQLVWLKRMRYPVISLDEYVNYRRCYRLPPAKSVVITFDDGYADNSTYAVPILARFKFPVTIFLVIDQVGQKNHWARTEKVAGRRLLAWDEIRELRGAGVDFGVHSRRHVSLISVPSDDASAEVVGTREELEQRLQSPARFFAYPYGEYDGNVAALVEKAGFDAALTIDEGLNTPSTPLHALRRKNVFGTESMLKFILDLL